MSGHDCVCLHAPGYRPKSCKCGVYEDEHGRWCANENCRANLSAAPVDLVALVNKQADRIAWLEGDVAGWRIKLADAREALGFYAAPVSYENATPRHVRPVIADQGEIARAALREGDA